MERFVKGDVVVLPFPFSNLSNYKKRPAFVIVQLEGDDIILCQITSKFRKDKYSVILENSNLKEGNLNLTSRIRPNKIFTADKSMILYKIGSLTDEKINEVINSVVCILKS